MDDGIAVGDRATPGGRHDGAGEGEDEVMKADSVVEVYPHRKKVFCWTLQKTMGRKW